jgi:hypothetical protein
MRRDEMARKSAAYENEMFAKYEQAVLKSLGALGYDIHTMHYTFNGLLRKIEIVYNWNFTVQDAVDYLRKMK